MTSQEAGPHRQDVVTDDDRGQLRRRAFAVAHRMLGAVGDAEDVAREAVLRLSRLDEVPVEPAAWVTTVAIRLALDELRRARRRREAYVGPWLPEPLLDAPEPSPGPAERAERAELADSLSLAFLVLLERLTPAERAAFLLREVFGEEHPRIAAVLERSEAGCRQLVSRARARVRQERPRLDADPTDGAMDVLLDEQVTTLTAGDLLVVPPGTTHAFAPAAGSDADVFVLFTPGTARFDRYRLLDRVHRGEADPQEIADSQDRFDNHHVDSPVWRSHGHRV